ncbi:hypothetical protein XENTR_v10016147 [Xenopus tropicalis]|nr:hypothetical protein XENTR_v10016147 [Xenopus tropicalis]
MALARDQAAFLGESAGMDENLILCQKLQNEGKSNSRRANLSHLLCLISRKHPNHKSVASYVKGLLFLLENYF